MIWIYPLAVSYRNSAWSQDAPVNFLFGEAGREPLADNDRGDEQNHTNTRSRSNHWEDLLQPFELQRKMTVGVVFPKLITLSITYLITFVARMSTIGGIVRPRALAVLRLIKNSNPIGRSTGSSAGLAPLRILSMR